MLSFSEMSKVVRLHGNAEHGGNMMANTSLFVHEDMNFSWDKESHRTLYQETQKLDNVVC